MADYEINGFTQDRFAGARTAFEANIANGSDIGASYCATLEGETVVDLWGALPTRPAPVPGSGTPSSMSIPPPRP